MVCDLSEKQGLADAILNNLENGLLVLDPKRQVTRSNRTFRRMFDIRHDQIVGRSINTIAEGDWNKPLLLNQLRKLEAGQCSFSVDISDTFPALGDATVRIAGRRMKAHEAVLLEFQDVTEAAKADEQGEIRVREADHRLKNLLATVQSIAQGSLRRASDLAAFEKSFVMRLAALGRTQSRLLTVDGNSLDVETLVREELGAHDWDEEDRVTVYGPKVMIGGKEAHSLSLVLHELATNAVKYGALRGDVGELVVTWEMQWRSDRLMFFLEWHESGVRIADMSMARGFGLELIHNSIRMMSGGSTDRYLNDDGLTCTLGFALTEPQDDGMT